MVIDDEIRIEESEGVAAAGMQLVGGTDPAMLQALHNALATVNEHVFIYDRNYVADYLGWADLLLDVSVLQQHPSAEISNAAATPLPEQSAGPADSGSLDAQVGLCCWLSLDIFSDEPHLYVSHPVGVYTLHLVRMYVTFRGQLMPQADLHAPHALLAGAMHMLCQLISLYGRGSFQHACSSLSNDANKWHRISASGQYVAGLCEIVHFGSLQLWRGAALLTQPVLQHQRTESPAQHAWQNQIRTAWQLPLSQRPSPCDDTSPICCILQIGHFFSG